MLGKRRIDKIVYYRKFITYEFFISLQTGEVPVNILELF